MMIIPKIVHLTWYSKTLPNIFENIIQHNKKLNTDFEFKLWCEKPGPPEIDNLLQNDYPDLYEIFLKCKYGVQKADIARIVFLYHFGGIYMDLDILTLKPLSELIDFKTNIAYLGMEPSEQTTKVFNNPNIICNAFMISPPKHPLFEKAIKNIKLLYVANKDKIFDVFNVFGADLLAHSIQEDSVFQLCKFIDRKKIYPINDLKFDDLSCSSNDVNMLKEGKYGDSHLVHYWIHSNFESKNLIDKFKCNEEEDINKNVYVFFKILYSSNKFLNPP